jgi:hypothetical protein
MTIGKSLPWIRFVLACLMAGLLAGAAEARSVDEVDLSGYWEPVLMEDYQSTYVGPDAVDFTGLPLNAAARARALSYSDGLLDMPERQCMYYGTDYLAIGPFGFRMTPESDPVSGDTVSWRISPWIDRPEARIWMDGRPHPGVDALHTVAGFTTGAWQGHTLTAQTTHLRESPLRRNGVPRSDQASMTIHFSRHGDYLQLTAIITDPIYLTEPLVLSRLYRQNPTAYLKNDMVYPCNSREQSADARGVVPNYLPGKNPLETQFAQRYGLPLTAALGGAQTMYPEYRHALEGVYKRPDKMCDRYCCAWGDARNPDYYNRYVALKCPGLKRSSPEVIDLIGNGATQ